ncbi:hypothetical protein SALBM311S_01825 [Streptomyces alboniger]
MGLPSCRFVVTVVSVLAAYRVLLMFSFGEMTMVRSVAISVSWGGGELQPGLFHGSRGQRPGAQRRRRRLSTGGVP